MASALIAAIAAFVAALFALINPGQAPAEPGPVAQERQAFEQSVDDLRDSVREIVADALAAAPAGATAVRELEMPLVEIEPAAIQAPEAPDIASEIEASSLEPEGCETERASGDGWARTLVRCLSRSTDGSSSSISISSSSSVTVQETN